MNDSITGVIGTFSNPFTHEEETEHINFHKKDQRTLIAFDGDIPWQGLPRGVTYLHGFLLGEVALQEMHLRKAQPHEEPPPLNFLERDGQTVLLLTRHFLLAPATTLLVRRYRPGGHLARYTLVEVRRNGADSEVTWRNSSY